MPKYCEDCGTKIRDGARFCEGCGKEIKSKGEMKKEIREKTEEELREEIKKEILNEQGKEVKKTNSKYLAFSDRKFILNATFYSTSCTLMIKLITLLFGLTKFGEIHPGEVWEIGLPLPWLKVSYIIHENISDKIIEVSNWLYLILDFIMFFVLAFAVIYVVVELRKKMK